MERPSFAGATFDPRLRAERTRLVGLRAHPAGNPRVADVLARWRGGRAPLEVVSEGKRIAAPTIRSTPAAAA